MKIVGLVNDQEKTFAQQDCKYYILWIGLLVITSICSNFSTLNNASSRVTGIRNYCSAFYVPRTVLRFYSKSNYIIRCQVSITSYVHCYVINEGTFTFYLFMFISCRRMVVLPGQIIFSVELCSSSGLLISLLGLAHIDKCFKLELSFLKTSQMLQFASLVMQGFFITISLAAAELKPILVVATEI